MIALLRPHHFHALEVELEIVAHAAVEDRRAGAADLGAERIDGGRRAQHRARHRIEHAAAMRISDEKPVRIDRRRRIDAVFPDIAVRQHHVDGFGFLRRRGARGIIGRDRQAVDDAALRRAGAGAGRERFQQARGAAGG